MSEPVLVAILFADRVITEARTQKKTIVGTFTTLNARDFPAVFPPFFVYAAVTNLDPAKKHSFELSITEDGAETSLGSMKGDLQPDSFDVLVETVFEIRGLKLEAEGTYIVRLRIGPTEVASRKLIVQTIDTKETDNG